MSQSTIDKIGKLFQKKKEELKITQDLPPLPNQQNQEQSEKPKLVQQDVQMSILNEFKELKEQKDKVTKKIKKQSKKDQQNSHQQHSSSKSQRQQVPNQYGNIPTPKEDKNPITIRQIAGVIWEDPTMADWPQDDYRLFVGNLGNEVTDTVLSNAFRKYNSFQRARVVRDKRSLKTKGFGFVSLGTADDYLKCYKEMNGAYVGNRPCKIEPGKWKDRMHEYKKDDQLAAQFKKPNLNKKKYKVYGRY